MNMKKLSIIIPTYNRPQMLERALRSIKTHFTNDVEVIVCDDNSESKKMEEALNIVETIKNESRLNILFLRNERAKGVSGARNYAVKKSSAEWLLFLDDDEFTEEYVDFIFSKITHEFHYDLLWSNIYISKQIGTTDVIVKKIFISQTTEEIYRDLISIGLGYGVLIRKSAFIDNGMFNEKLKVAEDTNLFFEFIKHNNSIIHASIFGVCINEHREEKLSKNYEYHAKHNIFRNLYRKNILILKKYDLLYTAFCSWVVSVYKQNEMYTKALIFCFEFLIKNFFSTAVFMQFKNEIKNLHVR